LYSKIPSARKPSTTISFIERDAPKISKLINCRFLCLNNRKRIKTTRMLFVWKLIDQALQENHSSAQRGSVNWILFKYSSDTNRGDVYCIVENGGCQCRLTESCGAKDIELPE
jgi:hypothetical protein